VRIETEFARRVLCKNPGEDCIKFQVWLNFNEPDLFKFMQMYQRQTFQDFGPLLFSEIWIDLFSATVNRVDMLRLLVFSARISLHNRERDGAMNHASRRAINLADQLLIDDSEKNRKKAFNATVRRRRGEPDMLYTAKQCGAYALNKNDELLSQRNRFFGLKLFIKSIYFYDNSEKEKFIDFVGNLMKSYD